MKKFSMFSVLFVLLGTLLLSACGVTEVQPVEALAAATPTTEANTPLPVPTETVEVSTPLPPVSTETPTPIPASPTASRMEFAVQDASLEVKIMDIERPYHVYFGADSIFKPGKGNMFLGVGIKVTNLTDSDISLKWSDIYLINKYQDKWYPVWGAYEKTNMVIDPLAIELLQYEVDPRTQPDARIDLGDNGYLRAIFRVPNDNFYYYFGFADLPMIEINYRDH